MVYKSKMFDDKQQNRFWYRDDIKGDLSYSKRFQNLQRCRRIKRGLDRFRLILDYPFMAKF